MAVDLHFNVEAVTHVPVADITSKNRRIEPRFPQLTRPKKFCQNVACQSGDGKMQVGEMLVRQCHAGRDRQGLPARRAIDYKKRKPEGRKFEEHIE